MMYPFNLNKDKYQLLAWSKNFQSDTYLNGKNEEIRLSNDFLEPEIVYYSQKNSLCIQAHPEWCIGSEGSNFCLNLINQYLLNKKSEKIKSENIYESYNPFLTNPLTPSEILESVSNSKSITNRLEEAKDYLDSIKEIRYTYEFEKKHKLENLPEVKYSDPWEKVDLLDNEL